MNNSANGPLAVFRPITAMVWYSGTDALYKGEAVCYNADYGTATSADASRVNRVERPSTSNNMNFAGVAVRDYSARSGGQFIEIYEPGSKGVPVALGVDTVINTGLLTFCVNGKCDVGTQVGTDGGRFYTGKYRGRGSAVPLQTVTAVVEASMTGAWSLAAGGVTLTVTDTTGLSAGDTVVLLGGEDDGTDAIVPGKYTISSVTDGTTLVLASAAADTGTDQASALTCTGYAYTGNPTAICNLLDGEESGGVEFINVPNAGGDNQPYMVGGLSYVCGGLTLAADAECELANASLPGDKKAFICLGTMTTSDFVVDLVAAGLDLDGDSALAEVNAIDAAGDAAYFRFNGAKWQTLGLAGGATEA